MRPRQRERLAHIDAVALATAAELRDVVTRLTAELNWRPAQQGNAEQVLLDRLSGGGIADPAHRTA
jgi:hypothetical protein